MINKVAKSLTHKLAESKIRGLYAIVDTTFSPSMSHEELAGRLLIGGCKILQLRIKSPDAGNWDQKAFDIGRKIMAFKNKYDFTFIMNDYVDVAAELKVDGIHVGSGDMPIKEIRKRVSKEMIIGYSSHSIREAMKAERGGADYVAFGAIFPTKTKGPGHPVQGTEQLKRLVSRVSIPVVAIGGICRSNIDGVLLTGAHSVAMITALTEAKDIVEEVKWYIEKIQG